MYGSQSSIKWIGKISRMIWSWTEGEKQEMKIWKSCDVRDVSTTRCGTVSSSPTMACGSKTPPDVQYIVIWLSSIMKPEDIAIYTGISWQSVLHRLHILWYFSLHGTIKHKKEHKKKGTHLYNIDLEVSTSSFLSLIIGQC